MLDFINSPLAWVVGIVGSVITLVIIFFAKDAIANVVSNFSELVKSWLNNVLGETTRNYGKHLGVFTREPKRAWSLLLIVLMIPIYFFVWKPGASEREIAGLSDKIAAVYHSKVDPTCFYDVDPYQKGSEGIYFASIVDKSSGDSQKFHVDVVEKGTGLWSLGDGLRRDERLKFALEESLWKVNSDNQSYVSAIIDQLQYLPHCLNREDLFPDEDEALNSSDLERVTQENVEEKPEVAVKDGSTNPEVEVDDGGMFSVLREKISFWD